MKTDETDEAERSEMPPLLTEALEAAVDALARAWADDAACAISAVGFAFAKGADGVSASEWQGLRAKLAMALHREAQVRALSPAHRLLRATEVRMRSAAALAVAVDAVLAGMDAR